MLTVTKKAATEAECSGILSATYAQTEPFGVPVFIANAENFRAPLLLRLFTSTFSRVESYVLKQLDLAIRNNRHFRDIDPDMNFVRFFNAGAIRNLAQFIDISLKSKNHLNAFQQGFKIPTCSIIATHMPPESARLFAYDILGEKCPPLPGYDSHWQTFILWHELAHSRTMDEATADHVAALTCRMAFHDYQFLSTFADLRAVHSVLSYKSNKYGIATALAVDSVIDLPSDPNWEDVKSFWPVPDKPKKDPLAEAVYQLGSLLKNDCSGAFAKPDLPALADHAEKLLSSGAIDDETQNQVASRFTRAAQRLIQGAPAYQKAGPSC